MSSQKRTRTQSSAAMEPDNHKRRELDISFGGKAYDRDDPEIKPLSAKDREKLGITVGSVVFCSYETTPLYTSFFRPEVVFGPPPEQAPAPSNSRVTASPSPAPAIKNKHGNHVERLYVCETCFRYTPHLSAYLAHADGRCQNVHAPPGSIVYISPGMPYHPDKYAMPDPDPHAPPGRLEPVLRGITGYALYEIDGDEDKLFCQNLSLFAKLWVGSKSVGFDVGGFVFYVLVQMTPPKRSDVAPDKFSKKKRSSSAKARGTMPGSVASVEPSQSLPDADDEEEEDIPNRIVGYFSKEKNSWDNNNLACILVFPPWQGQGIGQLLIEASYYLGEREGRFGGPERPLSESGRKSYESYWANAVARSLIRVSEQQERQPTILDVANDAWIVPDDVIATLKRMDWAEGLLANSDVDKAQRLVVDRKKVVEWIDSRPDHVGLEQDGWLFDDSSGEDSSDDDGDSEDDSDEGDVPTSEEEVMDEDE